MPSTSPRSTRLPALDWMRGLVMVLMTIDHAGSIFDGNHLSVDSASAYQPGMELPLGQFLTRWITHLCAPSFLFLAGAALALSIERRRSAGRSESSVDRHLLTRGTILIATDLTFMSVLWLPLMPFYIFIVQVLFAIGASMVLMVPLRRLSTGTLIAIAAAILIGSEALVAPFWSPETGQSPPLWVALLLATGFYGGPGGAVAVLYCVLPWLAMMILGWVFGRYLLVSRERASSPVKPLLVAGLAGVTSYAVIRVVGGYGNMFLGQERGSLAHWLLVSKYPPSLAYVVLFLGLLALGIAGFWRHQERRIKPVNEHGPLLVFGQVPFFFYLLHFLLLGCLAWLTDNWSMQSGGLAATWIVTPIALGLLYPACRAYRTYKVRHPDSWTRFL